MRRGLCLLAVLVGCVSDDTSNPDGGGLDATSDSPSNGDAGGDGGVDAGPPVGDSVITRANHNTRDALFTQSSFDTNGVATLKLDPGFDGTISGNVYAQVLFFQNGPNGKPVVIAATANDQLTAMDADTGVVVWQKTFGTPAGATGAGCGNVAPIGIIGTPAIDPQSRTIFFSAVTGTGSTINDHQIHAVSLDDGTEKAGFPVNASTASYQGTKFSPTVQGERGAILYLNGVIYVPYGGHYGDCGSYHGWVVGVPFPAGSPITAYAASTAANTHAAGIWAPGGPASDGTDVFVTTGNTFGATTWGGQEAVLRLKAGPTFSNQTTDYWAPHDWLALDNGDVDIGGTGAMVVDVPGATPSKLVVALGKDGNAYLIDRTNLGGIGASAATDGIANLNVASGEIINTPASVTSGGATYVYLRPLSGSGVKCATGSGDLVAVKITPASPPTLSVAWCATSGTQGSPIVTTTDGSSSPIVWVVGSKLLGFDGVTGKSVYAGTDTLSNVRKFTSPIAAHGRIYIGADSKVYSFKP
ncbi:MAG TPA: hypothetical protein VH054_12500 [Polyangiaceae bacterium]|nr:hypothetical protein [Polyangiaceae bacterium]